MDDVLKLMETLREDDAMEMVEAAVRELHGTVQTHVVLLGFCVGGGLSFRSALTMEAWPAP